jgi:hypothetical protein
MTPDALRTLVLRFEGVREQTTFGVHEFRLKDRAFITLGSPEAGWAMIKLSANDQARFVARSNALSPEPGGRGARGATRVRLVELTEDVASAVLKAAWRHANASKRG